METYLGVKVLTDLLREYKVIRLLPLHHMHNNAWRPINNLRTLLCDLYRYLINSKDIMLHYSSCGQQTERKY